MGVTLGSQARRRRRLVILLALLAAVGAAGYFLRERREARRLLAEGEQALAAREYARAHELLDRYLA
ncbi:MAG TPA: hypothetical protein VIL46_00735, partial [Gemmataceae bacterium]